jgi:hypothetical protein
MNAMDNILVGYYFLYTYVRFILKKILRDVFHYMFTRALFYSTYFYSFMHFTIKSLLIEIHICTICSRNSCVVTLCETIPEFSNDEIDSLALTYGYLIEVLPSWKQWRRICGNASDDKSAAVERSSPTMKRRMVAH